MGSMIHLAARRLEIEPWGRIRKRAGDDIGFSARLVPSRLVSGGFVHPTATRSALAVLSRTFRATNTRAVLQILKLSGARRAQGILAGSDEPAKDVSDASFKRPHPLRYQRQRAYFPRRREWPFSLGFVLQNYGQPDTSPGKAFSGHA
jgi:hypothetical protein